MKNVFVGNFHWYDALYAYAQQRAK